ncbi:MAG: hypothetical protein GEV08_13790 [Acidimicrobiia bacterium]|nr:hypothetical protein [Acidimicrobiia bacterium]
MFAVEWSQGIEDAWSNVAEFVPKLVAFLIILLIGWFVARAIAKIADRVLERVGFDRWVERGGIKQALDKSKYDASDLLAKVVYYALFLLVLQMAFGVFGDNPVSDMLADVVAYLPKVIVAILIIVVAAAIAAAAKDIISGSLGGLSYGKALGNIASIAIVVVGAFAALNQLQIAPQIVSGLFYALLATIAGVSIIAIGGGGIAPMRRRWEQALQRWDEEKPALREQLQQAPGYARQRAQDLQQQAGADPSQPYPGGGQQGTGPYGAPTTGQGYYPPPADAGGNAPPTASYPQSPAGQQPVPEPDGPYAPPPSPPPPQTS